MLGAKDCSLSNDNSFCGLPYLHVWRYILINKVLCFCYLWERKWRGEQGESECWEEWSERVISLTLSLCHSLIRPTLFPTLLHRTLIHSFAHSPLSLTTKPFSQWVRVCELGESEVDEWGERRVCEWEESGVWVERVKCVSTDREWSWESGVCE